MLNKKAQIGETITWVVATVIIIFVLIFFLFGASMLAQTKNVGTFRNSLVSPASYQGDDIYLKKNLFTYYSVDKDFNKKLIEKYLLQEELEGNFLFSVNETKKEIISKL